MVDARIHNRCESQAYRMQFMTEEAKRYCGAWINRQPSLFPWLEEELGPLTAKLERLVIILDTLGLEAFVAPPPNAPTAVSRTSSVAAISGSGDRSRRSAQGVVPLMFGVAVLAADSLLRLFSTKSQFQIA